MKQKTKKRIGLFFGTVFASFVFISALLIGTAWESFGAKPSPAAMSKIKSSEQFENGAFTNLLEEKMGSPFDMIARYMNAKNVEPTEPPPVEPVSVTDFAREPESGLRFVWLGHSTVLIEIGQRRVLLDPVFSDRSSPWQYIGPSRFHDVPITIEDLPDLDAVLISHDHYDHLDHHAIKALEPKVSKFFVPLGIGSHLEYWGVPPEKISELDWWESDRIGRLQLHSVPARHFSGRSAWDRNRTLWTGWVLKDSRSSVFYSGDTSMFPGFKEIGNKYGPFDLTIIEVGAYDPTWADVHLGPEQAVQAHLDAGGKMMFGVHWGTFNLGAHGWTEPMERLKIAADKEGVVLVAPKVGQFVEPSQGLEWDPWWPKLDFETSEEAPVISSGLEE